MATEIRDRHNRIWTAYNQKEYAQILSNRKFIHDPETIKKMQHHEKAISISAFSSTNIIDRAGLSPFNIIGKNLFVLMYMNANDDEKIMLVSRERRLIEFFNHLMLNNKSSHIDRLMYQMICNSIYGLSVT